MQIHIGYKLVYSCPKPTPMIMTLNVHYSLASRLVSPDHIRTNPSVPINAYRDGFGNWCSRLVAPQGDFEISTDTIINDDGQLDEVNYGASQFLVEELPEETLVFLLGSRYCETDRFTEIAWGMFGNSPTGWGRVQAICDFVHQHIRFGYEYARATKSAWEAFKEGNGVCRDYTHLAIALCRSMNIPARYCTGYLTDVGIPLPHGVMDFAAWFEAFLDGHWYTFDPRNNERRIGRILIARGRDAADVAISNTFGINELKHFMVRADQVVT